MHSGAMILLLPLVALAAMSGFAPHKRTRLVGVGRLGPTNVDSTRKARLFSSPEEDSNNDDDISEEQEQEEDWRDFRAKLIRQFESSDTTDINTTTTTTTTTSTTTWAYESGNAIETGSVILSRPVQDFGYGLKRQYFHKCVILVLEHDATFTRGIILNRPTDLVLTDDDFCNEDGSTLEDANSSHQWNIWDAWSGVEEQEINCLHFSQYTRGKGEVYFHH